MANPQAEDGHIDIANEIAEALCRVNLSAYEYRVIWFILRKTWGWHKKMDRISYSQFEEGTGINRRHLGPTIKRLIERQIITCSGNGHLLEYGFQKDYEKWQGLTSNVTYSSNETLPKEVTTEERYKNVTANITPMRSKSVTAERTLQAQEDKSLPIQGDNVTDLGTDHYRSAGESLLKQVNTKETIQKKLTKETITKERESQGKKRKTQKSTFCRRA